MDASNLLKPALARGELHCVGATTLDEYRKHVEKDAALARRFQPVMVDEPTVEDTISILRGLKEKYEQHHKVRISHSALAAAATLSNRYITDRSPAGQGDRPDGRSRFRACAPQVRFLAGRARRTRPPDHSAEDRARGPEEGKPTARRRTGFWKARSRSLAAIEEEASALTARWQAEKPKLGRAADLKSPARRAAQRTRPSRSARVKSPSVRASSLPTASSRSSKRSWRRL